MFTFLSEGDLEKLIAAGGKKGKGVKGGDGDVLEKVEYMQKDEMRERQKKEAEERQKRRDLVDGGNSAN